MQLLYINNLQLKVGDLVNAIYFVVGKNNTMNINKKKSLKLGRV